MASITKTFTETEAPGASSDELFVRPGGSFTWSSIGTIDAGVSVALQWSEQPGAWRDIKRWTGTVSETGRVLNGTSGARRYRFHASVPTTDPATVLTSYEVSATEVADVLEETRAPDGTSVFKITESGIESPLVTADTVSTDTISEKTAAAGVTIDSVKIKDGNVVLAGGSVQHPNGTAAGAIAEGFGVTSAEGFQTVILEETISFADNVALYKALTASLPANAIVLCAQANIEAALTGGGTTAKLGLGTAADPDLYGLSAALTKNAKIDHVPAAYAVIGSTTALRLSSCATNGAAGDTALTVGSVRVRIVYRVPVSLADAA